MAQDNAAKALYVGNLHPYVNEAVLQVFLNQHITSFVPFDRSICFQWSSSASTESLKLLTFARVLALQCSQYVCLQDIFSTLGTVTEVRIVKDKATGGSAGSAFVHFADHNAAEAALNAINGRALYNQVSCT